MATRLSIRTLTKFEVEAMRAYINFCLKILSISAVSFLLINGNVAAGELDKTGSEDPILLTDSSRQGGGARTDAVTEKDVNFQSKLDEIWEILEAE